MNKVFEGFSTNVTPMMIAIWKIIAAILSGASVFSITQQLGNVITITTVPNSSRLVILESARNRTMKLPMLLIVADQTLVVSTLLAKRHS